MMIYGSLLNLRLRMEVAQLRQEEGREQSNERMTLAKDGVQKA
jgi:hypothetical protein